MAKPPPQTQTVLKASDYALVRASGAARALWRALGELEHDLLAARLERIAIEAPVFVTGLARSGTTMMLTVLSQADGVATHRYRDFPFLFTPLAWNWFQDRMPAAPAAAVERPHRDRIRITRESAEAFEEPLWQEFFPWAHDPARCHVLDAATRNPQFEAFFASHLRKILWLRGGRRYVSKGNYNVARIAYLARLFPDARFVVPVREPFSHVRSLVEQHALFCRYAADDPRVPRYLAAAGHYEFGPQRRPIHLDPARLGEVAQAWRAGDDWRGYARQWAQVYDYVARLRADPSLAGRIRVVRYEDACARPQETAAELLAFTGLGDARGRVVAAAGALSAPTERPASRDIAALVWAEVAQVAARYGYPPPHLADSTRAYKAAA
jgi:hypothetical protein